MVLRQKKKSRKFLGSRRWGVGNIKNARGKGSRGGVGKGGRKGKFTYAVKYDKERIRSKGFAKWKARNLQETNLDRISKVVEKMDGEKPVLELRGYKVLSNGRLSKPCTIKASAFSKGALEKIGEAKGEAVTLE
jgi:ribosomal protein L15